MFIRGDFKFYPFYKGGILHFAQPEDEVEEDGAGDEEEEEEEDEEDR